MAGCVLIACLLFAPIFVCNVPVFVLLAISTRPAELSTPRTPSPPQFAPFSPIGEPPTPVRTTSMDDGSAPLIRTLTGPNLRSLAESAFSHAPPLPPVRDLSTKLVSLLSADSSTPSPPHPFTPPLNPVPEPSASSASAPSAVISAAAVSTATLASPNATSDSSPLASVMGAVVTALADRLSHPSTPKAPDSTRSKPHHSRSNSNSTPVVDLSPESSLPPTTPPPSTLKTVAGAVLGVISDHLQVSWALC